MINNLFFPSTASLLFQKFFGNVLEIIRNQSFILSFTMVYIIGSSIVFHKNERPWIKKNGILIIDNN